MAQEYEIPGGPRKIRVNEGPLWAFNVAGYGGAPTGVSVKVFEGTTDVTTAVLPGGVASTVGDVINLTKFASTTARNLTLELTFTTTRWTPAKVILLVEVTA